MVGGLSSRARARLLSSSSVMATVPAIRESSRGCVGWEESEGKAKKRGCEPVDLGHTPGGPRQLPWCQLATPMDVGRRGLRGPGGVVGRPCRRGHTRPGSRRQVAAQIGPTSRIVDVSRLPGRERGRGQDERPSDDASANSSLGGRVGERHVDGGVGASPGWCCARQRGGVGDRWGDDIDFTFPNGAPDGLDDGMAWVEFVDGANVMWRRYFTGELVEMPGGTASG